MDDERSEQSELILRTGTFEDFRGYDGDETTDVTADHDAWGVSE